MRYQLRNLLNWLPAHRKRRDVIRAAPRMDLICRGTHDHWIVSNATIRGTK